MNEFNTVQLVHHSETTSKVTDKSVFCCTGKMFVDNLSSSYEESYSSELQSVLSREEHIGIISRLNMTLSTYWPGGFVYATGSKNGGREGG